MKHTKLISQFAQDATQTPRARHRVRCRIGRLVDQHFYDSARRDGRGRRAQDLRRVEKLLRHLNHAIGWRDRRDLDPNVRQEARALVRTACHAHESLEKLMKRASALRGRVNRSGKVRNARKPVDGCLPLREGLPQRFAVERLHTVERLAKAGRRLGNCATDNGYGLHDRLRQRESDFYLVQRGDEAVAMFEVELETAEINEFLGRQNEAVDLPCSVLLALLARLQLNGDHVEACLQRGAASIFATGSADVRQPDWRRGNVVVWCATRRLLVKEGRKRERWSSFEWDGEDWMASNASRRSRLDDLMTRYPSLASLASRAVKSGRGRARRPPGGRR